MILWDSVMEVKKDHNLGISRTEISYHWNTGIL